MRQQVIPITGGLDLTTDKLSVPQGTAQACLNYHVGVRSGITRIKGFSRYDGRSVPVNEGFYIRGTSTSNPAWALGQVIDVNYEDALGATHDASMIVVEISEVADYGGGTYLTRAVAVFTVAQSLPTSDYPINYWNTLEGAAVVIGEPYAAGTVLINPDAYYQAIVTQLPGDTLTRVPGLHFFNDKLYAVTDLVAIQLTPTAARTPLEGASIYVSGNSSALGKLALARTVPDTPADVIWELFDYTGDGDLAAGTDLLAAAASHNLVQNGNFFATTVNTTDWVTPAPAGWAYSTGAAGLATAAAPTNNNLTHVLAGVAGYAYEVTITVTLAAGSVSVYIGGVGGTAITASGTYTETIVATGTGVLTIDATGFQGTVDDVSVRIAPENIVYSGDFSAAGPWAAGAGWAVGSGVATATTSSNTLTNTRTAVSGLRYRLQYTVPTRTAGSVQPSFGGATGTSRSAAGTYVDYLTAVNANALVFTGTGFSGTLDNVSLVVLDKVGDVVAHVEPTRAALYYADWDGAGGWTRLDLGRRVEYVETNATDATAFFLAYQRRGFASQADDSVANVADTGWVGADGVAEDLGGGSSGWSTLDAGTLETDNNTESGDAGHASLAIRTNTLKATFSADALQIPAGALVRGVEVKVFRRAQTGASEELVTIGCTSTPTRSNKADPSRWLPVVAAGGAGREQSYGGSTDVWQGSAGASDLRPSDINDGGFNVQIAFRLRGGALCSTFVDCVQVKVHYQEQTRAAFVNNANGSPWDQEVEVIHYTVAEGTSASNGNRRGILVLNSSLGTAADRPWVFGPDMGIYTEDDRGGALLAFCASVDTPITLPSSYAVDDESAQYVFHSANPYASDLYDVTFICSGAEHAYMFDGDYALPIQTGLFAQFEKPRHVVWAGNYLALGYRTGTLSLSDVGAPLTYASAASIATEIGTSDRVTGLLKLKGDSLGVFTERTIFALQGATPVDLSRVEISTSSGAIEYSVLDIGQPVFLDYRGPATIATTDRYGDFNRGRLSGPATPWFLERLQLPTRNATVDRTFVAAYLMRHENQARYLFADGWQATLTFGENDQVHTTTQRYYGNWQSRDASAIKVLAVCHGTTSTGQDVAFMSFASDPTSSRYRYVFQVDTGRSFDGEEIIAQWTSQPIPMGPPFFKKHPSQVGITGLAYGYAVIKMFAATDFETPVSDESTSASATGTYLNFGTAASATLGNFKTIGTLRVEGEDVTLLFESISATELPHTIQNIVLRFDEEEARR